MIDSFDVIALGELLVDFTGNGNSAVGNPLFEACPGGAPCNVLSMLRKFGRSCAFVGKVGDDLFGNFLENTLKDIGIDTAALSKDPDTRTTLAFVQTLPGGDRSFSFYRNPGADMCLQVEDLPEERIRNAEIFHFGTLSMTHDNVRAATERAVALSKSGNRIVSFDPNIRLPLWKAPEDARNAASWGLGQCDVLKIADNELLFMTGISDIYEGAYALQARYPNIKILNVTAGAEGSYSFYKNEAPVFEPAYHLGGVIDTTGAGDAFCGSVLNFVLEHGTENLSEQDRSMMLRTANAAAYIVSTRHGAIRSMPNLSEITGLMQQGSHA